MYCNKSRKSKLQCCFELMPTVSLVSLNWLMPIVSLVVAESKELVSTMHGHSSSVHQISVHGSGRYAISTSQDTSILWDLDTFTRKRTLNGAQTVGVQQVRVFSVLILVKFSVSGQAGNSVRSHCPIFHILIFWTSFSWFHQILMILNVTKNMQLWIGWNLWPKMAQVLISSNFGTGLYWACNFQVYCSVAISTLSRPPIK